MRMFVPAGSPGSPGGAAWAVNVVNVVPGSPALTSCKKNCMPSVTHKPVCADPADEPAAKMAPATELTWISMLLAAGADHVSVICPKPFESATKGLGEPVSEA